MVYGYNRIPIVKWLRNQATESLIMLNKLENWLLTLMVIPL